jgi:hypothetical protein
MRLGFVYFYLLVTLTLLMSAGLVVMGTWVQNLIADKSRKPTAEKFTFTTDQA